MTALTTPGGVRISGFTEDRPLPQTQHSVDLIAAHFGADRFDFDTYDSDSTNDGDHGAGLGIDVWFNPPEGKTYREFGDEVIAWWHAEHGDRVAYDNWQQALWSWDRRAQGWRPYASRGGDTDNHRNHWHMGTKRTAPATEPKPPRPPEPSKPDVKVTDEQISVSVIEWAVRIAEKGQTAPNDPSVLHLQQALNAWVVSPIVQLLEPDGNFGPMTLKRFVQYHRSTTGDATEDGHPVGGVIGRLVDERRLGNRFTRVA